MSTPEELLCSRKWRLRQGAWMLFGWVPFALTAWAGYLIIGIRARNWKWIVTAVVFFTYGIAFFSVMSWVGGSGVQKGEPIPEPYNVVSNITMWTSLLVWIGNAAVVQWFVNRKWLVWRAHHDKKLSTPWYATATAGTVPAPPIPPQQQISEAFGAALNTTPPTPPAAPLAAQATTGASEATAATPPRILDVNSATTDELASLPGFDVAAAAAVVAARDQVGGFRELTDLVTRAGVKPHVLANIQDQLAITTPPQNTAAAPTHGRRLEF